MRTEQTERSSYPDSHIIVPQSNKESNKEQKRNEKELP